MAEFRLECLNKISNTNYTKKDWIISKELDFCEECNELKHVVICRRRSLWDEFLHLLLGD